MLGLVKKFSKKGLVGPAYKGLRGKLRLVFEHYFYHEEFIHQYTDTQGVPVITEKISGIEIIYATTTDDYSRFVPQLEQEYYPDFTSSWPKFFEWGDELALILHDGELVAHGWLQSGSKVRGTYYLPYMEDDWRIYRGGVLPSQRRKGYQTCRHACLIKDLINNRGAKRIFGETYTNNLPSHKALDTVGYKRIGKIGLLTIPGSQKVWMRWITFRISQ